MTARDRTVIIVVFVVAAIAGAWMLVIQPKRSEASKLGDKVTAEHAQLNTAQSQVAAGEAARSAYASSYASLARLGEAVPADDNVPSLIYQVQAAANTSKVDFQTLSLNSSGGSSTTVTTSSATQAAAVALPPGASMGPAGFPIEPFPRSPSTATSSASRTSSAALSASWSPRTTRSRSAAA